MGGETRREHAHGPGGHAHGAGASDRRIAGTVGLNVALTVAQVVGGVLSGSVALVADALHNLNDAMSLAVAFVARRIAGRRADERRTFGYRRAEVVGATVNLVAMAVVALFLAFESIMRVFEARTVDGWTMIALALVALAVDVATVLLLGELRRGSTNLRAAFVHNLSDALASVAVLVGGAAILTMGWSWVDPLLSLAIVGYIVWQVVAMLPPMLRVLMESAPPGLDLEEVTRAICSVEGVEGAHHLHIWLLDERRCALEAHVVVGPGGLDGMEAVKAQVRERLAALGVDHATLELERSTTAAHDGHDTARVPEGCADLPDEAGPA